MASTIRGDGLQKTLRSLEALAENTQQLDGVRRRFSESPPSYRSDSQSYSSSGAQSSCPPSEEQRLREKRRWQLIYEHEASFLSRQFESQSSEERRQIVEVGENRTCILPAGTNLYKLAEENIKKRWVEQGIWNEKWKSAVLWRWRWKHEEPLEPESELVSGLETDDKASSSSFPKFRRESKPRQAKRNEEKRRAANLRAAWKREHDASRPFYQFFYQVSKERERIQEGSGVDGAAIPDPLDINTTAYEKVKNTWIKRGIWSRKWGILPAMSWKHEQPLEEMLKEEMGDDYFLDQPNLLGGDGHVAGESPSMRNSDHQDFAILTVSPQETPTSIGPSPLLSNNTNHSSLVPSLQHSVSENKLSATRQKRRRRESHPSQEDVQIRSEVLTSIEPVQPSRVLKTPRKKGNGSQRRPQPSSGLENLERLPQTTPVPQRRSKHIQKAEPSRAADAADAAAIPAEFSERASGASKRRAKRRKAK